MSGRRHRGGIGRIEWDAEAKKGIRIMSLHQGKNSFAFSHVLQPDLPAAPVQHCALPRRWSTSPEGLWVFGRDFAVRATIIVPLLFKLLLFIIIINHYYLNYRAFYAVSKRNSLGDDQQIFRLLSFGTFVEGFVDSCISRNTNTLSTPVGGEPISMEWEGLKESGEMTLLNWMREEINGCLAGLDYASNRISRNSWFSF